MLAVSRWDDVRGDSDLEDVLEESYPSEYSPSRAQRRGPFYVSSQKGAIWINATTTHLQSLLVRIKLAIICSDSHRTESDRNNWSIADFAWWDHGRSVCGKGVIVPAVLFMWERKLSKVRSLSIRIGRTSHPKEIGSHGVQRSDPRDVLI